MYFSHQGQQAVHQDIVNSSLRRAEQRRMIQAARPKIDTATKVTPMRAFLRLATRLM